MSQFDEGAVSVSDLETPNTVRPILRLALPILAEELLAMMIGFSDRILTGHYLGTSHLAAVTLIAYLLWLGYGAFSVVAIGATAMVSRAVGAGDYKRARKITTQSFLMGTVIAVAITALGLTVVDRMVYALQLRDEAARLAIGNLKILLPAIPLVMADAVGIACLRAAGDAMTGLIVMVIVNIVNLSLSWVLVLGIAPFPHLGWAGIAVGTLCGYIVGGGLIVALLLRGRSGISINWRRFTPDFATIGRLLWVGLPGGADMLTVIGCQLWFLSVINQLGALATAAHGVALSVEAVVFLPGVALQMAAATLAGQYLGARDPARASRSVWTACGIGLGVMAAGGAVIYSLAGRLTPLFVSSEQSAVALAAEPLVRTVSLAMPALALMMILTGALRGAGDTRWPLVFSLIGFLGVRIPAAYWLAFPEIHLPGLDRVVVGWNLGVVGTWYAMVSDLTVRAALVLSRFLQGRWKDVEVL